MAAACDLVISRLWKDILSTLEALIVPPLSDQPTEMKPLSEKEIDIVFKWLGVRFGSLATGPSPIRIFCTRSLIHTVPCVLQFLVNYFHASGQGVALEDLRNAKYRGGFSHLSFLAGIELLLMAHSHLDLVEARMFYDWPTDQLMEEDVRSSTYLNHSSFLPSRVF